jgi:hypothetical protein
LAGFVGGFAEQLGARRDALRCLARLVHRLPGGLLRSLGDLTHLLGNTVEGTAALTLLVVFLLLLVAFAHFISPFGKQ